MRVGGQKARTQHIDLHLASGAKCVHTKILCLMHICFLRRACSNYAFVCVCGLRSCAFLIFSDVCVVYDAFVYIESLTLLCLFVCIIVACLLMRVLNP